MDPYLLFRRTFVTLVAVLLLCIAAPSYLSSAPQEESEEIPSAEMPLKIPDKEKQRPNPVAPTPDSLGQGQDLFQTQCAMCHGPTGDGKGDLVKRLGLKVPDYTDPKVQRSRTDGELRYILTVGHGQMPGEGERMPEDWKWHLVNYMRSLEK
jgi:mono/diheme cytochrome c family protein